MAAHNARPIRCIETGHVFPSVTLAAEFLGMHRTGLISHMRGETSHCGGYHWEYADGKPAKTNRPRSAPSMTITEVQEEAARRTRETGRYTRYADIQKEETVALIRQRDAMAGAKLARLKKGAKR